MTDASVCVVEKEVLSVRELATFMGVSTQWVYQNKKDIPHRRVGNLFFFHRDAIRRWLDTKVETEVPVESEADQAARAKKLMAPILGKH